MFLFDLLYFAVLFTINKDKQAAYAVVVIGLLKTIINTLKNYYYENNNI
jgi:hypothetical protein